jgi:hypothetical protein
MVRAGGCTAPPIIAAASPAAVRGASSTAKKNLQFGQTSSRDRAVR